METGRRFGESSVGDCREEHSGEPLVAALPKSAVGLSLDTDNVSSHMTGGCYCDSVVISESSGNDNGKEVHHMVI